MTHGCEIDIPAFLPGVYHPGIAFAAPPDLPPDPPATASPLQFPKGAQQSGGS